MTRPTARGISLLVVSVVTYVAARILGEWELYLVAFAFLVSVGVAWAFVAATGRRLGLRRSVEPAQPVAGDPLQLTFRVQNGSLLPGLQVTLVDADGALGGGGGPLELDSLGSRSARVATSGPWPARRGVHHLTDQLALAEDPMGLVRTRRSLGGTLDVTVVPRLTRLPSCSLLADATVRRGGGRRPRRALDASEFHGIRPHNPGEPLNRVDWKATAKTGSLMLREMEDVTDGGAVLLLNGLAPGATGPQAEADFETAVQVAGSVADYALRSGRPAAAAGQRPAPGPPVGEREEPAPAADDPGGRHAARPDSPGAFAESARRRRPAAGAGGEPDAGRPES